MNVSERTKIYRNNYYRRFDANNAHQIRYDFSKTMENIIQTWKLDAKLEDEKLFCYRQEVDLLKEGIKSYVIGRKGTGKTALCDWLYYQKTNLDFTYKLSFKNFPFNELYNLSDTRFTNPNQYITLWQFIIYNSICKMMASNESIDSSISAMLQTLYPQDTKQQLGKLIKKWTTNEFSATLLQCGVSLAGERTKEDLTLVDKVEILENIILDYAGDCKYYVLIDELDEDYKSFGNENEKKLYFDLLTSLFKAVQQIKSVFDDSERHIFPIIFLRNDIYSQINDSDKNKWSDFRIDLFWSNEELKKMLIHRIKVSMNFELDNDKIWDAFFIHKFVRYGDRDHKQQSVFDYMSRSTHLRPRDYIKYIIEVCNIALMKNDEQIKAYSIKDADNVFSDYFKDELLDEITPQIPNINDILSIFSQIRKQTFEPQEFLKEYCKKGFSEEDAKEILKKLFDFGVIGNAPSMKGKFIFKYQTPSARFNFNERLIIHRGLYKALQIY